MSQPITLTASNLVSAIRGLSKNQLFQYPNPRTKTRIRIKEIEGPEGPIHIYRDSPSKKAGKNQSMSKAMLWRVALAIREGQPFNIDRILGASYNTRSSLEALLAHTPEFYVCYPGRVESTSSTNLIKSGHKHLIWVPSDPHELGVIGKRSVDVVVSEIAAESNIYDAIELNSEDQNMDALDIAARSRHIQIQLALVAIGKQLGFRTYIAKNDQGVTYRGNRISEIDSVVKELKSERIMSAFDEAMRVGRLIDCVWFKNGTLMPAVMEVEHSTGIKPGLSRMKEFKMHAPPIPTRWTIVAPDQDRAKVVKHCNQKQFKDLDARFFPYSAVEELYSLCKKRNIQGVSEEFLDSFMEKTVK